MTTQKKIEMTKAYLEYSGKEFWSAIEKDNKLFVYATDEEGLCQFEIIQKDEETVQVKKVEVEK